MANKARVNAYLLILALAAIAVIATYSYIGYVNMPPTMPVAFRVNNRTYQITGYAYTASMREKGLMNATVTSTTFMLFRFDGPGIYPFWMKDTYSQLDIIWLNYSPSDGIAKIVYMVNATPCIDYSKKQDNCTVYTPNSYSNYVIEAKSGFIEQNALKNGDTIKFLTKQP